ncbi:hypothetical protein [Rugosimonospora africana]|uniref:Uncharacterized protein n=1 Tax=Rugosimonospora africana TaxID=556532 RepID=A0A8J3QPB4_9ACTN|nr:hypothetical protein [Rugosimonospora africana]GIH13727.1 hypothetical protein Raf01_18990 [Rugosimonospora africana]
MSGEAGMSSGAGESGEGGMGGTTGGRGMDDVLERRYRRLLAWYPAQHRARYEDEMVGTMLAGAGPGQRWPGAGETVDVLLAAVRARLGRATSRLRDPRWYDAAATVAVLLSMLLVACDLRISVHRYAWSRRLPDIGGISLGAAFPARVWAPAVVGLAVTVAVLVGRRVVAATVAWAAVLGAVVLAVHEPLGSPPLGAVSKGWLLVATIVAAVALSLPGTAAHARAILGWPRTVGFAVACALLIGSAAVDPLLAKITSEGRHYYTVELWPNGGGYLRQIFDGDGMGTGLAPILLYVAALSIMITVVARIEPAIRRRLLALLAPAVVFYALVSVFFRSFEVPPDFFGEPGRPVPPQWVVLIATPVLTFLVALLLVRRADRTQRLADLGRTALRQPTAGDGGGQATSER